jgi:hypothetical protein
LTVARFTREITAIRNRIIATLFRAFVHTTDFMLRYKIVVVLAELLSCGKEYCSEMEGKENKGKEKGKTRIQVNLVAPFPCSDRNYKQLVRMKLGA